MLYLWIWFQAWPFDIGIPIALHWGRLLFTDECSPYCSLRKCPFARDRDNHCRKTTASLNAEVWSPVQWIDLWYSSHVSESGNTAKEGGSKTAKVRESGSSLWGCVSWVGMRTWITDMITWKKWRSQPYTKNYTHPRNAENCKIVWILAGIQLS